MSSYFLSRDAQKDLEGIWDYIAEDNADAADRVVENLFLAFDQLARNPDMGHRRSDLTTFPVLFWPVGNYLIIYRKKLSSIEVVGVTHGGRDMPSFLTNRG